MRLVTLLWVLASCSSTSAVTEPPQQPAESNASEEAVYFADFEDIPIPRLIEIGMRAYAQGQYPVAIRAFEVAMKADGLNMAGRAIAYWILGGSYVMTNNKDRAMDSYMAFVVVAQDIIELRDEVKFVESPDGKDFVDNFDLHNKLEQASKFIEDTWKETKGNGNSGGED